MVAMRELKIGVSRPSLPTTTRMSSTGRRCSRTIKWKAGTTPQQIASALKGAETIANTYTGITRVWTRSIKVQGDGYTHALVMEFKDEKSLKDYADSPAQKEWYKIYLPLREESTTHDITN